MQQDSDNGDNLILSAPCILHAYRMSGNTAIVRAHTRMIRRALPKLRMCTYFKPSLRKLAVTLYILTQGRQHMA
jgi:hypothetical protein